MTSTSSSSSPNDDGSPPPPGRRRRFGVVEYFGRDCDGHRCGYCGGQDSALTWGMWGHALGCAHYQQLVDRGWRRSGKYLYKPCMKDTCCPQYTIRCQAADFKPSKSHKKVLKRFRLFLLTGQGRAGHVAPKVKQASCDAGVANIVGEAAEDEAAERASSRLKMGQSASPTVALPAEKSQKEPNIANSLAKKSRMDDAEEEVKAQADTKREVKSQAVKPGLGADPSRPPAIKAKDLRRERARQKKIAKGEDPDSGEAKENQEKSLEDFIEEVLHAETAAHAFEIRMVRAHTGEPAFDATFEESFGVYKRYQVAVHDDEEEKVTPKQFKRFLCDAALFDDEDGDQHRDHCQTLGAYHQQYLLDGRIFMVGVVDVLPACVSSVYLYYDPSFAFLSPGTLSALYELAFARRLRHARPALQFYYMGFYIHSCPKMRYKGQYKPSFLLCPESTSAEEPRWAPLEESVAKLDASKYARLVDSGPADFVPRVDHTLVLFAREVEYYRNYKMYLTLSGLRNADEAEVKEYHLLVGRDLATNRMLLFRK